jgi:hypothetical protein
MAIELRLSEVTALGFDLGLAISEYRVALQDHAKTEDVPAPTAHPLVEQIVKHGEGQVVVVDDTPIPTPAELRFAAMQAVQASMMERINALASPARRQLAQHDLNVLNVKPVRTAAEDALVAAITDLFATIVAIERHSLLLQIEIEDLPDDQVAGWAQHGWPA